MEGHDTFTPDDDERLSRVESALSTLSVLLRGDRSTRNKGFINEATDNHIETSKRLDGIEEQLRESKVMMKQIRVGVWCLLVGIFVSALIFGFIKLSDLISVAK